MSETEKRDGLMTGWYVLVVVMAIVTVLSWAFSDSIYGEDSVFNSAPTGNSAVDGFYQMIPDIIDSIKVIFIVYIVGKILQFILTKALSGSNKGITASKLICSFIKYAVAIVAILALLSAWGVDTATLVASAGILKNAVGVFGMLVVLGMCVVPFLQLGIHYLAYKITAALSATVSGGRVAGLIDQIGGAFGLVLGMTGACALLLLISMVSAVTAATGG